MKVWILLSLLKGDGLKLWILFIVLTVALSRDKKPEEFSDLTSNILPFPRNEILINTLPDWFLSLEIFG